MTTAIIIILMIDVLRSISPRLDSLSPHIPTPPYSVCLSVCLCKAVVFVFPWHYNNNGEHASKHSSDRTTHNQNSQCKEMTYLSPKYGEGRDKQAKTEH